MKMRRLIRVKDLKDQVGTPGPHPILRCVLCDAEISANKGDYFVAKPTASFRHCGKPMKLVVKTVVYEEVEP